ncbi:response regulator transcription factor [Ilumatobacter sp.]|uniref:response regulator transcription factor n=1 Tax=Ilumatobacter sp. TaxID=1967498 RepID=UPI0037522EB8
MSYRVLVVEDAPEYAELITAALRAERHEVITATTLSDARDRMRSTPPDLVILDLTLPDGDGLDLCREIRQDSDAFVILLTGRDDEVDKLVGFRLGADDYVTKPFSPRELGARVGALLARTRGSESASRSVSLHVGDLRIDAETRSVTVKGNVAELTKIEFNLLNALAKRPGSVLTRSQLRIAVWGDNYVGDEHVVDVHIANLRKKIDTGKPSHVRTVRGIGYAIHS